MNLHQKLLLSLCHAKYEREVKEATRQLMKEVEEVLLRMCDDNAMGAENGRAHSERPNGDDGIRHTSDDSSVVRLGSYLK